MSTRSQRRQEGYDQAKKQHEAGTAISLAMLALCDMPRSDYVDGGLEYVAEQLLEAVTP